MGKLKKGVCGRCKEPMQRVMRMGMVRFLIGSELFICRYCNQPHLFWLGFDFKLKKPRPYIPR